MKLHPLDVDFGTKLIGKLRKIDKRLSNHVERSKISIDKLVMIGNGYPDNIIVAIACYHFNGVDVIGVVKPEFRRIGAIQHIRTYLKQSERIDKILLILDQEDDSLDQLHADIKSNLSGHGFRFNECGLIDDKLENRLLTFDCRFGAKSFRFIVVINGLNNIKAKKHNVEDHLIYTGVKLGVIKNPSCLDNPKDIWNSLDKDVQLGILKRLLNDKSLFQDAFYPLCKGFEILIQ